MEIAMICTLILVIAIIFAISGYSYSVIIKH
jgi:hypothetical protein